VDSLKYAVREKEKESDVVSVGLVLRRGLGTVRSSAARVASLWRFRKEFRGEENPRRGK
jgi:hypothetical protein